MDDCNPWPDENKPPKTVIKEDEAPEYNRRMQFFFTQLVNLNINLYIVEHVLQFPFTLFFEGIPKSTIFFKKVVENFLDASLLIITKLCVDTSSDFYTLPQFKNKIIEWIKPEYEMSLKERLDKADFEKKTKALHKKARRLRDKRVAHFKQEYVREFLGESIDQERLDFSELKILRDELNNLLQILSINAETIMLPFSYQDNKSDIELVLNSVARDNYILNMAERDPEGWLYKRKQLTEKEVSQINHYRRMFGLPEI